MEVNIGGNVLFTLFETIKITDSIVITWGIMLFLTILGYLGGRLFKNRPINKPPEGAENLAEALYELVEGLVVDSMGEHNRKYIPYMGTLMIFLIVANLSGLLGLRPPTSDLNTTAALALLTFILIQAKALEGGVGSYFKGFIEPFPMMLPLNLISEISTPFSLCFRLFGNLLSGYLIMTIIYNALVKIWYVFFLAQPFHLYFDLFSGVIQTLIFASLTMAYISIKE
ncbi:MAG TPA: F0F1 ATP synthase subunit A [Firmicutes bacterium]|jgi:F-type H+-transporting ATPase subunit a|nr:F0F1 ATP synthase subunit A [Bacillota bacterium]